MTLVGVVLFLRWMGLWKASQSSTQRRERRVRLAAGLAVLVSEDGGGTIWRVTWEGAKSQ